MNILKHINQFISLLIAATLLLAGPLPQTVQNNINTQTLAPFSNANIVLASQSKTLTDPVTVIASPEKKGFKTAVKAIVAVAIAGLLYAANQSGLLDTIVNYINAHFDPNLIAANQGGLIDQIGNYIKANPQISAIIAFVPIALTAAIMFIKSILSNGSKRLKLLLPLLLIVFTIMLSGCQSDTGIFSQQNNQQNQTVTQEIVQSQEDALQTIIAVMNEEQDPSALEPFAGQSYDLVNYEELQVEKTKSAASGFKVQYRIIVTDKNGNKSLVYSTFEDDQNRFQANKDAYIQIIEDEFALLSGNSGNLEVTYNTEDNSYVWNADGDQISIQDGTYINIDLEKAPAPGETVYITFSSETDAVFIKLTESYFSDGSTLISIPVREITIMGDAITEIEVQGAVVKNIEVISPATNYDTSTQNSDTAQNVTALAVSGSDAAVTNAYPNSNNLANMSEDDLTTAIMGTPFFLLLSTAGYNKKRRIARRYAIEMMRTAEALSQDIGNDLRTKEMTLLIPGNQLLRLMGDVPRSITRHLFIDKGMFLMSAPATMQEADILQAA